MNHPYSPCSLGQVAEMLADSEEFQPCITYTCDSLSCGRLRTNLNYWVTLPELHKPLHCRKAFFWKQKWRSRGGKLRTNYLKYFSTPLHSFHYEDHKHYLMEQPKVPKRKTFASQFILKL